MNILFFLIPKQETAYLYNDCTILEALDEMEEYRYTAVPLLDRDGKYIGTLTEGDLLRKLRSDIRENSLPQGKERITRVKRRWKYSPVRADAKVEDLISAAMNQNFVPVVDDNDVFIGIVSRKSIIEYCYQNIKLGEKNEADH